MPRLRADEAMFTRWYQEMVIRGVLFHPLQFENMFVSLVHDDKDIDDTLNAAADALAVVARTRVDARSGVGRSSGLTSARRR